MSGTMTDNRIFLHGRHMREIRWNFSSKVVNKLVRLFMTSSSLTADRTIGHLVQYASLRSRSFDVAEICFQSIVLSECLVASLFYSL